MQPATTTRYLVRGGLCGAAVGTLGPAVVFVLLSWQDWQQGVRYRGFFAAAAGLLGALPGLANGVIGTLNGLLVGRHRGGWPVEFVPVLMLVLVWVWDRDNPKVGMTLTASLVPAAFVAAAGFLGQGIGIRGRTGVAPAASEHNR
jgi:uncharacterized membrane protein